MVGVSASVLTAPRSGLIWFLICPPCIAGLPILVFLTVPGDRFLSDRIPVSLLLSAAFGIVAPEAAFFIYPSHPHRLKELCISRMACRQRLRRTLEF